MPNLHDIERRINSVKSTKQITRTMEMVAAAKIRHATERVEAASPYAQSMNEMLASVAECIGDAQQDYLIARDTIKKVLFVVIVSDRGLAGGFNTNVLRHAEQLIKERQNKGQEIALVTCGKKALAYFKYRKLEPVKSFVDLSADPSEEQAQSLGRYILAEYEQAGIDEAYLVYNHAKNAAEQVLRTEQLLPVPTQGLFEAEKKGNCAQEEGESSCATEASPSARLDFEPDPETVLKALIPAYVKTSIYHALIDSAAGEQGARRNPMKSATDNANDMVDSLTRIYNRVRQGAITTEISEIVGGAAALEE